MKLYELKRNDMFKIDGQEDSPIIRFDHVDGMYSVCYIGENLVHLSASTPVILIPEEI